jgi:predicted RecA/RadA family phage recombinase
MAQTYIQPGETLDYTVPAGGVTSGDVVVLTDLIGIALVTGVENDVVSVGVTGVYEMDKAANTVTIGQKLYYDEDNEQLTTSSEGGSPWGDLVLAGYAAEAAASGVATVKCKLVG